MATKPTPQQARNKDHQQYILNDSFDPDFKVLATEPVIYDGTNLQRMKGTSNGSLIIAGNLIPHDYDYIELSYTGSNLTGVVYKTGGLDGTTVATLTLAYTGSQLDSITKT